MKITSLNIIVCVVLLAFAVDAKAQNSDDEKVRIINQEALRLIDEYERECEIFEQKDYYDFLDVFGNDTVKVANDILPDNQLNTQLSVSDYPLKLNEYFKELGYNAQLDVEYLSPVTFNTDTSGYLTAYVDKSIKGKHSAFDIVYSDTIGYAFKISFDGLENNYRIDEIKIRRSHGKYCMLEAYRKQLFGSKSMKNEDLIINLDTFQTNDKGRILMKDIKKDLEIKTVDENIFEIEKVKIARVGIGSNDVQDKNLVKIDFKEPFLYWKTELEYVASAPVKLMDSEYDIHITNDELNYSAGFKIGAILASNQRSRYLLSAGIFYSNYQYQLGLMQYHKSYDAEDPDGDEYERIIELSNFKETHSLQMVSFPLTLSGEFKIYKDLYVGMGAGVRYFLPVNVSSQINTEGQYSGYYEDLFGVTFSENGVYDFGHYTFNEQEKSLNIKKQLMAWNANIGLKYQLSRRNYLNIDFSYLQSFSYLFQKDDEEVLSRSKTNLNSLTNIEHKFLLENWLINIGYLMKF